jgi:hypothetical protein
MLAHAVSRSWAKTWGKSLLLIATLLISLPGMSQVGHPAKGSWSGYLGHDTADAERIRLLINAHNGELTATINPGRRAVEASKVTLDAPVWKLVIEADLPEGKLVLDGTLSNLGSWTNRKYIGTYTLGGDEGQFNITLN